MDATNEYELRYREAALNFISWVYNIPVELLADRIVYDSTLKIFEFKPLIVDNVKIHFTTHKESELSVDPRASTGVAVYV